MSKKRIDDDAYDVSPAVQKAAMKLLDGLTKDLEAGCRSVEKSARLSDDAKGTFRRRYRLSLQRVLSNPATATMNHRQGAGPGHEVPRADGRGDRRVSPHRAGRASRSIATPS